MGLKLIRLPDLGEGVTEGEIIKIKVAPGDSVSMDQPLVEVMTDKASMEIPSSVEGIVEDIKIKEGSMVSVGEVILALKAEGDSEAEEESAGKKPDLAQSESKQRKAEKESAAEALRPPEAKAQAAAPPKEAPLALPSTRQLAREVDIPLESIAPSGEKGEIKREDLIRHIRSSLKAAPTAQQSPSTPEEELKRESLKGIRRIMFDTMTLSKSTIPHFTIMETARMDRLIKIRGEIKARLEKQNIKITYLPFFMKAAVSGLKNFSIFNSFFDSKSREVVYKKRCHLGFAADTPQGLLVPVIRNAESKSLLEIAQELQLLGKQAREGRIQRDDLKGGSLTLTNLGSIGGLYGTPIINPPEAAILGIYRIYKQPQKNSLGEWEESAFINFSITCDHRLIDGAAAARFLKHFVSLIEEPSLLLLE